MKKLFLICLLLAATSTWAQSGNGQTAADKARAMTNKARAAVVLASCDSCGTVQTVQREKRKGKSNALGAVGGAVVGGVLGNQVGSGTGKTVATVGGAVAGGLIGNEVQKRMTRKKVWVTTVKMKDGSVRTFEQDAQPVWVAGNVVAIDGTTLTRK